MPLSGDIISIKWNENDESIRRHIESSTYITAAKAKLKRTELIPGQIYVNGMYSYARMYWYTNK